MESAYNTKHYNSIIKNTGNYNIKIKTKLSTRAIYICM